jgi:hypothetical protein
MKKTLITLLWVVIPAQQLWAQEPDTLQPDTLWKKGGILGINITQIGLSNWAAGGQNSVSGTGLVSLFANYKHKKSIWDNSLDLGYGMINQGNNGIWVKSDDKIDFASKYGLQAFDHCYYAAALSFKTQFAPGFDDPYKPDSVRKVISNFMAPGYIMLALGLDYKPNDKFNLFVSPVTGKMTLVQDQTLADAGAFGVEGADLDTAGNIIPGTGKQMRVELGGSMKSMYKVNLMENVSLMLKVELFTNYLENPGNIDVNGELLLNMKVNKFLSVTFNALVLYDDDIDIARDTDDDGIMDKTGPITQIKEVLGVGFNLKF